MDPVLSAALPMLAWAVFLGAAGLATALCAILAYHWTKYAMSPGMTFLTVVTYAAVAIILLVVLFATTITIWVSE